MNEQAIEKAIEVYLGPDCYTEADIEAVRPHLIEAITAYRDAEIADLRAKLEVATLMTEVAEQQLDWLVKESRKADLHFMLPDWNGDYGCVRDAIDAARGGEHG